MRFRAGLLFASMGLVTGLVSGLAEAADVPSLDLRGFRPPADPAGFLYLEPSTTPGPGNFNIGVFASYALSPVRLESNGHEVAKVIAHQVSLDYVASVGIGEKWAFNVGVPTILYQTGDDVRGLLPQSTELPATTIGSIALGIKRTLIAPSELGGFGLSLLGTAYVPTDPKSYVSDRTVAGELRALGELDLLAISVRATAGVHVRGSDETLVRDGSDRTQFGNDVPWGVGITVRPQTLGIDRDGHFRWTAEARGAIALDPSFASRAQSPVVLGLSSRYTAGDVSALFGLEAGVNGAAGNPVIRPVIGLGWAPRFEDADKDGIADDKDECPELAEDKDGFEDRDGCPDFDDDDDGVPDETDRCPREKEDTDDFQDEDGCPDLDNDNDGVPDATDACPNEKGPKTGQKPGCTDVDTDNDGLVGDKDQCPDLAEDKDGKDDDDGCPDLDDDGDKIPEPADACPTEKGEPNAAPERNGCPNPDHDGDTLDDAADHCPDRAEDFDGVEDEDGCPEPKGPTPLAEIASTDDAHYARLRVPLRFGKDDVDPRTMSSLRSLAVLLNTHPQWVVAIGSKPANATAAAVQAASNRALAVALDLRYLTHRDNAAEAVGWGAVKDLPGAAATGLGLLVLIPRIETPKK
jgi:hypothetical protein